MGWSKNATGGGLRSKNAANRFDKYCTFVVQFVVVDVVSVLLCTVNRDGTMIFDLTLF